MSLYLNQNNSSFVENLNLKIYVDNSRLISITN